MKKSLFAVGLTLSMVLAMATPAFAANTNVDGTEVTKPGHPEYTVDNVQLAGESHNAATIESKDGTKWETTNDDDNLAKAADLTGADINVWAKVVDSGSKVYKVDLAWGAMKFEYTDVNGQWDPALHTYTATGATAAWTTGYIDATNNKVAVTNHSNNAIDATFGYKMGGTAFNAVATSDNAVIGNFFMDNTKALAAALKLTGTHAGGAVVDATVADKLPGSKVALPTADAYNDGTNNVVAGARTGDVFFAFSGAPDKGKGKDLDTFKKVGVITVTVTPNNEVALNRPTTP